ncbi:MAG: hypothetical protein CXR30_01585 [Geobacter sp.]|nr:MAG: hypothetical protein CXR30_01585 [Geobacter sp.]
MLKDVVDGLTLVADGIKSVTAIAEAVKSGKDYLKTKHPEVQNDLRKMVQELGKSLFVIKQTSAVLTNFRFAIATDTQGTELARFNDYFIKSKTEAQFLRNRIDDLRTHCSKVREHGTRISGSATAAGFAKIFSLLGLGSPEKEMELGERLDKLAYEDFAIANSSDQMLKCLEDALRDVQDTLGNGGAMYPQNVPDAAALLAEYGPEFERMEERATEAAMEIRDLAKDLGT